MRRVRSVSTQRAVTLAPSRPGPIEYRLERTATRLEGPTVRSSSTMAGYAVAGSGSRFSPSARSATVPSPRDRRSPVRSQKRTYEASASCGIATSAVRHQRRAL